MNALDSPLEALAFNYLSYGLLTVVNNMWTWVAVLTAAISFWRIRASVSPISDDPRGRITPEAPSAKMVLPPSPPCTAVNEDEPAATSTSASSCTTPVALPAEGIVGGGTRGKFTVYFAEGENVTEGDGGGYVDGDGDGGERWCEGWEKALRMRTGESGWYRFQDLTVLDGSVVRLWEGCSRRRSTARLSASGDAMWL